jgi:hypothetical protein
MHSAALAQTPVHQQLCYDRHSYDAEVCLVRAAEHVGLAHFALVGTLIELALAELLHQQRIDGTRAAKEGGAQQLGEAV